MREPNILNARREAAYALYLLESVTSSHHSTATPRNAGGLQDPEAGVSDSQTDDSDPYDSDPDDDMEDSSEKLAHRVSSFQLDSETLEAEMACINMDDDERIVARIRQVLSVEDQRKYSFSAEDEIAIGPPQSQANVQLCESD